MSSSQRNLLSLVDFICRYFLIMIDLRLVNKLKSFLWIFSRYSISTMNYGLLNNELEFLCIGKSFSFLKLSTSLSMGLIVHRWSGNVISVTILNEYGPRIALRANKRSTVADNRHKQNPLVSESQQVSCY